MNKKRIILIGNGELYSLVKENINDFITKKINGSQIEELITYGNEFDINKSKVEADLILSAGYNKRIVEPLKNGLPCINIHLSPLPKYAGFNLFYWAIRNNEKEWGVTMHKMVFDFDAGDIIYQSIFPISPGDTARSLYDKSLQNINEILTKNLENLLNGNYTPRKQEFKQRTFYKKNSVNYEKEILFDGSEDSWREIRARYFPPFSFPRLKIKNNII